MIIRVEDPLLTRNTGSIRLEAGSDGASVTRIRRGPDLIMNVRELSASYLAGTSLLALTRAGLVTERTKGAAAAAAAAFAWVQSPFCPTSSSPDTARETLLSAEQTAQRTQDVAIERAVDVAEQFEWLAGVAEERAQGPGELGPDEAEQQDPDVQQEHARRAVAGGGLRCLRLGGVLWF